MCGESIFRIHYGHALDGLEFANHVHVAHQAFFQIASGGEYLTEPFNAVCSQVCFVNQLCGARRRGIKSFNTLENSLHHRHSPAVFGLRLPEGQRIAIHTNQARVVDFPGRDSLLIGYDFIKFWLTEIRAVISDGIVITGVNHPSVRAITPLNCPSLMRSSFKGVDMS